MWGSSSKVATLDRIEGLNKTMLEANIRRSWNLLHIEAFWQ